jgi:SAM-dependent methyltransferase
MLAPRSLPSRLHQWNRRWRVPEGLTTLENLKALHGMFWRQRARRVGPFAFQLNNSTRIVEYAWAFHVAPLLKGLRVADIGGGLSGLQFVLAREGAHVINVDPFEEYGGKDYRDVSRLVALHSRLNRAFRTRVELIQATLPHAELADGSLDRIYSISVFEHLAPDAREATMAAIRRVLRPGGLVVLTLDLFLDLEPFTGEPVNRFGRNVSVADMVDAAGLDLAWGRRDQLFGYPEFDVEAVRSRLQNLYVGHFHPCLAQLLVLRKPGPAGAASALCPDVLARDETTTGGA